MIDKLVCDECMNIFARDLGYSKMNEQTNVRNWMDEKKMVDAIGKVNWFKPENEVTYQVTFLDDGGPDYTREFEDRTLTQVDFRVMVTGGGVVAAEHSWSVTKGGPDSLYGKLVGLFASRGKAVGVTVEVTAVGEGRSRRYLVRGL